LAFLYILIYTKKWYFQYTIGFKGGNNPDGSNLIEDGPTYLTIKEVIANTKIKNAKIKGIIFKVPSNISRRILNFRIKDCNGDEIQCVCFDEVAEFFFKQLKEGQ
jgi:hypothetical protein